MASFRPEAQHLTSLMPRPPLPRGPVLGWSSLQRRNAPGIGSVEKLRHLAFLTSGRAAIYQALLQLQLAHGSGVLIPTYHCPTMVAPVLLAGLEPNYFGIGHDGLPLLDSIGAPTIAKCKAMIVPHYFGLPQSLSKVRAWCDAHAIALIEDCAHSYFGKAGERSVGAWGDYATASLSKFFPVPEAGLLASAGRRIQPVSLSRPTVKGEIKGWVDVFELAARYKRLPGINRLLSLVFGLKNARGATTNANETPAAFSADEDSMMRDCDMGRIRQRPLGASMALKRFLPRGRIIAQRQENFAVYASLLSNATGARPLFDLPASPTAPYVFPLWVDDADRVYHALRALALPVFRWDRIWPGTPQTAGDAGPLWSRHVLQLLCHQDLSTVDVTRVAEAILQLLPQHMSSASACPVDAIPVHTHSISATAHVH